MSIETAIRELVRDVVRDVVRDELSTALHQSVEPTPQIDTDAEPAAEYVSAKTAATILEVNEETIRVWTRKGVLPAHWAGRLLRIKRADIDRFVLTGGNAEREEFDVDAEAKKLLASKRK